MIKRAFLCETLIEEISTVTKHMRVLRPAESIFAFYDGRVDGYRFAEGQNWVDDGALSLGIASYAIVDGNHALVYDTHVSIPHARFIRDTLAQQGVTRFTVLLSHWHLDHVAGNDAFADCEIIANERTAAHLMEHKQAIEAGTYDGLPAIAPLVLPTRTFTSELELEVGDIRLNLIEANIHSDDATVIWLPERRLLLAGDTMEDTVTYVAEPGGFAAHLADLDRLWELAPERILPNHGDPGIIAAGGYGKSLVRATQQYIRALQRCIDDPALRDAPLRDVIAGPLQAGWINYFAPYEDIHRRNVAMTLSPPTP
jgi:glyoxylase-like metal-dependent hydrolase (beta-lactamase superfamily II)